MKMGKRSLPSSSGGGTEDNKRQMTDLVGTFRPEQEQVWKSLQETFDEEQRNIFQEIMS